jgi:5-hydroxyisourate hydrolase
MSQITTHILNTASGKPAQGVTIILYKGENDDPVATGWKEIARGKTNEDGRISNLLDKERVAGIGMYKMRFETKDYFDQQGIATFYPYIEIVFNIPSGEHYHIPLLLSPFGYSTYRGS